MNIIELNHIDLNSIGLNSKVIDGVGKLHGGKVEPYIAGHVTDGSSTFTFTVNGNESVTVPVDANGNWKWVVDRTITSLYSCFANKNNLDIIKMICPDTITSFYRAFYSCSGIVSVFIKAKSSLSTVVNTHQMFTDCQLLESLKFGDGFMPNLMASFLFGCIKISTQVKSKWFARATDLSRFNMNGRLTELDLSFADNCTDLQYILQNNSFVTTLKLPNIGANVPFICGANNNSLKNVTIKSTKSSLNFAGAKELTEQSIANIFNSVAADDVVLTFHQNVWNMIMREIDVQGSPIQVAYQNMIDNYDVTIANASFDAEIEYLGMSGTQYVDSNFKANTTTTKVETKIQIDGMSTNIGLFGSRNTAGAANSASCNAMIMTVGQKIRFDWVNGDANVSSDSLSMATDYSITTTRGLATINGTEFVGTNTDSVDQIHNFLIGNFSNGSSPFTTGFNGKFYWFKIYNNNQLVRDFIPVRKDTTGYLYDKISGNLFGNSGTGDFILGNDK